MKKQIWKIMVICGTTLILSAVCLCVYNINQSNEAFSKSQNVLAELKNNIPDEPQTAESSTDIFSLPYTETGENPADDLFSLYEKESDAETETAEPIYIDGQYYCGYVSLPVLGIELPVMSEWSYPNLQVSPCRYSGIPENDSFIIAAHNYNSHFGRIKELCTGDEIIFTGTDGVHHKYEVNNTELIDGYDVDKMFEGQNDDWDMTLFTCTLSGQSRVTVRADRIN